MRLASCCLLWELSQILQISVHALQGPTEIVKKLIDKTMAISLSIK